MSKINKIIVASALPVMEAVGKVAVENLLLYIKAHTTEEIYQSTLRELHSDFSSLKEETLITRTGIDYGMADLVLEAVKDNAHANGIVLS